MVVIIYSTFGSIRAVIFTSIFQFLTIGTFIPTLALVIWSRSGNLEIVTNVLTTSLIPNPKLLLDYYSPTVLTHYSLLFYLLTPCFNPALFQQVLLAKNTEQVSVSFKISAIIYLVFCLFTAFIGLVILSVKPDIESNNLIMYIIDSYSHSGLKGLIIVGVIAMIISTADSFINSASIIFINDLYKPLGILHNNKKIELQAAIIFTILINATALVIVISQQNVFKIFLLGVNFYTPIASVPLLITILGFRSSTKVILSGMASGMIVTLLWNKYFELFLPIGSAIPASITNFIVMMTMHYLLKEPKGWIGPKDRTPLNIIKMKCYQRQQKIFRFFRLLPCKLRWSHIVYYCSNNSLENKYNYIYFTSFIISSLAAMLLINTHNSFLLIANIKIIIFCMSSSLIMSTILMAYKLWPKEFCQKYIGLIWHVTVFYTLVFVNTILVLINKFFYVSLAGFLINLMIVGFLIRWYIALLMIMIGIFLGLLVFRIFGNYDNFNYNMETNLELNIAYVLLMVGGVIIMFFKPKQDEYNLKQSLLLEVENATKELEKFLDIKEQNIKTLLDTKKGILNNLSHEIKTPMSGLRSGISLLHKFLPKYYKEKKLVDDNIIKILDIVNTSIERLISYSNNLYDLSKLEQGKMLFNITKYNFKEILEEVISNFAKSKICSNHTITLQYTKKAQEVLDCDKERIKQVIFNLILNAVQYSESGLIKIKVKKYYKGIEVLVKDEGIGIPKEDLQIIFEPFEQSSKTRTKAGGKGLGLSLCSQIISFHNGKIWAEDCQKGSKIIFRLPLKQSKKKSHKLSCIKSKTHNKSKKTCQMAEEVNRELNILAKPKIISKTTQNCISQDIKKVLIVDDELFALHSLTMIIYTIGYNSTAAYSGKEAIELIKENPSQYSLIFLDMMMPDKNGDEVLKEVYTIVKQYNIPVVIQTGYTQSQEMKELLHKLGVVEFITKPYNSDIICKVVNLYLKR